MSADKMSLVPLAVLVLVLPFEPMEPLARVAGFQASYLEVVASVLMTVSGVSLCLRARTMRSRSIPLAGFASAFLAVCVLSSVLADGSAVLPLKFTLRMLAAVVVFLLTATALARSPRVEWLLFAFAAAGALTAALALLEAASWPPLLAWTAAFREHAFEVGGRARVAATFSYPNTAGGFLVLALAPALFFLTRDEASSSARALAWVAALGMFTAILLTYSRGALLGALVASLSFWRLSRRGRGTGWSLPALHLGFALVATALFFAEPSYRWRTSTEGDESWYRARIEPRSSRLQLAPQELACTGVVVENVGKLTWDSTAGRPFHLSYRWFRADVGGSLVPLPIEGERTALPCPLAPGEGLDLEATVRAPRIPGRYVLVWDMVQEHTTWFSDKVGLGAPVVVDVGSLGSTADTVPNEIGASAGDAAWRPGRRDLWRLALTLFAAHPVLGVGPDNFRWLYGPAAGRSAWDTRVFSNSLYLELLSTVGLAGFLAFAGLVARALFGLRRLARVGSTASASASAAALAASLLGFLAHGLVDYLLAFTPIYLALFILLGASSAALVGEQRR